MKDEDSNRDPCPKITLQKTQLKLNENWKFDPKILLRELKIQPENSTKRQLYRELNEIKRKLKLFNETTKSI